MHPVDVNADRRVKYAEQMGKCDFSSLTLPVPLQSACPFALRNNMSINVYGMDDLSPIGEGEDVGEMCVRKLQEEAEQLFQEYIVTPQQSARAYRGGIAFLPHCHQMPHMQPAAGRAQRA